MIQHVGVGDPAASSLSSCLCSFPGGFSLLTETGLLRPYLVASTIDNSSTSHTVEAVAAATLQVSAPPSQQGYFPVDRDIPVDHAWSLDGRLLVVLRRSSFSAYCRRNPTTATTTTCKDMPSQARPAGNNGPRRRESPTAAAPSAKKRTRDDSSPSLDLEMVHTGRNGFEGKVVACCLLRPAAAAAPAAASSVGQSNRRTYLICIGGTFGIERHAIDVAEAMSAPSTSTNPGSDAEFSTELHQQPARGNGSPGFRGNARRDPRRGGDSMTTDAAELAATCQPLTPLFQGYPVIAIAISPDSGLVAAAAMTGHVRVWEVSSTIAVAAVAVAVPQQQKEPAGRARGRRGKGKRSVDGGRVMRLPRPRQSGSKENFLWSVVLPMVRATSLSFSPEDSSTFALACWDGSIVLFLPGSSAAEPGASPDHKDASPIEYPRARGKDGGKASGRADRAWMPTWRENPAPAQLSGGKGKGGNLEDQDGSFLCWCKAPRDTDSDGSSEPADVAVSSYGVKVGACLGRASNGDDDDMLAASATAGTCRRTSEGSGQEGAVTGPGFEVLAGGGLGERVAGAVTGSRPPGVTESTAERYLIHGLAAGPNFAALYDSDLCLHVVSLAALLGAGEILPPLPRGTVASEEKWKEEEDGELKREVEGVARGAVEAFPGPVDEKKPSSPEAADEVTLSSNDHGLITAEVSRHGGSEEREGDGSAPPEGLGLSVTWRNAITGEEIPDDGACVGDAGRLPFLPGYRAGDGDDERGGVFGADVRWGLLALFTRYTTLVYTRPGGGKFAGKGWDPGIEPGGDAASAGGWRSYPHYPIADGVLFGGASTASPLSKCLPSAPPDLTEMYLLAVLETDGDGNGPVVTVRSLSDQTKTFRCRLNSTECSGDGDDEAFETQGVRVHVSPRYGGGVFVVAAQAGAEACANIRRGAFDEATGRVALAPPKVITSSPWPDPKTLRLEGVSGPNCELVMFKQEVERSPPSETSLDSQVVRWWITYPELEIWKYVDAPARVGGEDLGASEFGTIFQVEVEHMLISCHSDMISPSPAATGGGDDAAADGKSGVLS